MKGKIPASRGQGRPIRLLLLGYLPPPSGGVRLLFRQLARHLEKIPGIRSRVVPLTGRRRGFPHRAWGLLRAGVITLLRLPGCDLVSLHPTNTALAVLGPWVYLLSRMMGKPIMVRKFGGGFSAVFSGWPAWLRALLRRTVLRADLWLFETRELCSAFAPLCPRVEWYPNSRPLPPAPAPSPPGAPKRLVFLGHMRRIKGVEDFYRLAALLPGTFTCHLYGPLGFDLKEQDLRNWEQTSPARYLGELPAERVNAVLEGYHWLVMPSRPGPGTAVEGHPGVILEAFSRGVPVLATRRGGITEILDATCGILVEPGDVTAMARELIDRVDREADYLRLRQGAWRRAGEYDARKWNKHFVELCRELVHAR